MRKSWAIEMLGGAKAAAEYISIVPMAVHRWPDPLNPVTRDRVLAALVRRHVADAMGLTLAELHESREAQKALEDALAASGDSLRTIGERALEHFRKSRPAGEPTAIAA